MKLKMKNLSQAISLSLVITYQVNSAEFVITTTDDASGGMATEIAPDVFTINTLRSALEAANDETSFPGSDVIRFDQTLFDTGSKEISLSNGELMISSAITINGPGSDLLTLDANNQSRLFTIEDSTSEEQLVSIQGVTMTGGNGLSEVSIGRGGCVANSENLTISESVVTGCTASGAGGGIWTVGGNVTLYDSWVVNNSATRKGGGLYLRSGLFSINNTTISDNVSRLGGGIYWERSAVGILENTTLSANRANNSGGGMYCEINPVLIVNNSTLVNNGRSGTTGCNDLEINNSIITGHTQADCQFGADTSAVIINHVIDSDGSCDVNATNHITVNDPQLEPLSFFGGITPTHRPLPGSPVIDAGDDNACVVVDQRNIPRPQDGDNDLEATCDIGAVEYTLCEFIPQEIIFRSGFDDVLDAASVELVSVQGCR